MRFIITNICGEKVKKKRTKLWRGGKDFGLVTGGINPFPSDYSQSDVGLPAARNENKADHTHGTEKKQGKSYYKYAAFLKFSLKCSMLYVKLKTIWRSKRKNKTSTHTQ